MAGLSAVGAALLLLGALAISVDAECRITAAWDTDDHLTKMHVRQSTGGLFAGTFTAAGKDYNITGFQQDEDSPTFTFTFLSKDKASVITYVGQCFTVDGEDRLKMVKVQLDPVPSYEVQQKPRISNLRMKRIYLV